MRLAFLRSPLPNSKGKTATYEYHVMDHVTKTRDGVGDVTVGCNGGGQMMMVSDGLNHTWTYAYDTALRLTSITGTC